MHVTFLLLIGWVALSHWIAGESLASVVAGVGFILALFGCVVLHEYGHALTARRYGIKTRDITLLPIGGVARLERMPDKPIQELWVALAGPAVNVVIAIVLYAGLLLTSSLVPLADLEVGRGSFIERLLVVNLFLVGFNMIPAFPMDGGRVVRALLAMRMEYTRATQIAASLGQTVAILFGFIGLFSNPFLLFIAFFVWIGAAQEASMVQMKSALAGIPASRAMLTDFRTLAPHDTLARAIELILAGSQQDFPVVSSGQVVGVLTRSSLMMGLTQRGPETPVSDVMQREFEVIDSHDMLEVAFARLQTCQCQTVPVMHQERLVGLLTQENVGEFLMIQAATRTVEPGRQLL
jgi:Zn-dependent protease